MRTDYVIFTLNPFTFLKRLKNLFLEVISPEELCNGNAVDVQEGKRRFLATPLELVFFQRISQIIIDIECFIDC